MTLIAGGVNGGVSFWLTHLPDEPRRPALPADSDADVVIVGAGLSGLWAAYHLTEVRADLRIVVLEAEHVGYGASGRNGGWLSQLIPGNRANYAAGPMGADGVARLQQAMLEGITAVVAWRSATASTSMRIAAATWWWPPRRPASPTAGAPRRRPAPRTA